MAIELPEAGPSTPPHGRTPKYQLSHSLGGHSRAVTALRFSPDGAVLVSAGGLRYIKRRAWLIEKQAQMGTFNSGTPEQANINGQSEPTGLKGINDIAISPDSLYVASSSDDKSIALFPLVIPPNTRSTRLRTFKGHTAPVLSVSFAPKADMVVSGSFDESAIIWDAQSGQRLRVLPAHAEAVWSVGWDREGGMVITGGADGLIRIWDAHSGQCLKTFTNDTNSPVSCTAFTPSSTYILSTSLGSTLRIYNIHTSKVLKTLRAPTVYISEKYPCPAYIYPAPAQLERMDVDDQESSRKEAWVVTGSENGKVVIWELSSRRVVQVLEGEGRRAPVVAIAVSPDGRTIASGSLEPEKTIHLWYDGA